ncbi:BAR domain-containing protein [Entamoeba marina]
MFKKVSSGLKGLVKEEKDEASSIIDQYKSKLADLEKKIKIVDSHYTKLAQDAKNQYDAHKKALKVSAVVAESSPNPFNECISIFDEADEKVHTYDNEVKEKVLKPLKTFVEDITIMQKRVKIMDDRKKAMNTALDKYNTMLKKPESKQLGLADLKVTYTNSRDSWEYLRDELSVDIKKVLDDVTSNFGQICSSFMEVYADYMRSLNEVWDKLHSYALSINVGSLERESVYTATTDSMVGEPNVQRRREEEIAQGTYKQVN